VGPGSLLAVSPHLDDAVFACGGLLGSRTASAVVTVFAGRPPDGQPLTEWDRASGFREGDDPIAARREEDRRALMQLNAQPEWLEFLDSQYRCRLDESSLAAALESAIMHNCRAHGCSASVLFPLGLFHSDHRLVSDTCLGIAKRHPQIGWFTYEDALYRRLPDLVEQRLGKLQSAGFRSGCVLECFPPAAKQDAVYEYQSQIRALATPGRLTYKDALEPERYRKLSISS
jgi:LmbE family N-acetylglucosaminyl deacetylase